MTSFRRREGGGVWLNVYYASGNSRHLHVTCTCVNAVGGLINKNLILMTMHIQIDMYAIIVCMCRGKVP